MGIFSSKDVTQVATFTSRVIADKLLPSAIKTGSIKSSIANDGQLIENIMEEVIGSIGTKAERMYEYARQHYTYGLPSGTLHSSLAGRTQVQEAIQAMIGSGSTVQMDYFHFGSLNNMHFGWMALVNTYGYMQSTNELTTLSVLKGTPVYLKDMTVVVTEASLAELANGSMEQWGMVPAHNVNTYIAPDTYGNALASLQTLAQHKPFVVDPAATQDHLVVEYAWGVDVQHIDEMVPYTVREVRTESLTIPVTGYDTAADYYQVKYTYGAGNTQVGYWIYKNNSGGYLAIDAVYGAPDNNQGNFFPFAYFRYDKKSMTEVATSDAYKTSKKLVKYLGIDYAEMIDSIHANPDIKDVEQAMLMMAVPANTTNPLEQRYLFEFFDGVRLTTGVSVDTPIAYQTFAAINGWTEAYSVIVQDARFKTALSFKSIVKRSIAGTIGKVGTYSSERTEVDDERSYMDPGTDTLVPWITKVPMHVYRKQISDGIYEELRITGLRMTYFVFGEYVTTGDGASENLLVPIDRSVTAMYSTMDKEELYARSLHYVFNSRITTSVAWYAQGWFQAIVVVVMVVITISSLGTYGPAAAAYISAIEAGTITLSAVLIGVLMAYILPFLLMVAATRLFVKVAGTKLALVVAIITTLAGSYQAMEAGSIQGAPMARELLELSTGMTSAINQRTQVNMLDLMGEAKDFEVEAKKKNDLLDKANDLLDSDVLLRPFIIFGETPNEYYQRTVQSGNIGILSIDAISSYVDVALTLPTFNETVGATLYG